MSKSFNHSSSNESGAQVAIDRRAPKQYIYPENNSTQFDFFDGVADDTELIERKQESHQNLLLPKIQTISGYIREHYEEHIIRSIQKEISNGNLGGTPRKAGNIQ